MVCAPAQTYNKKLVLKKEDFLSYPFPQDEHFLLSTLLGFLSNDCPLGKWALVTGGSLRPDRWSREKQLPYSLVTKF